MRKYKSCCISASTFLNYCLTTDTQHISPSDGQRPLFLFWPNIWYNLTHIPLDCVFVASGETRNFSKFVQMYRVREEPLFLKHAVTFRYDYCFIALACIAKVAEMPHSRAKMSSMMEMPKKMPMVPPNWETRQSSWHTKYSSLASDCQWRWLWSSIYYDHMMPW